MVTDESEQDCWHDFSVFLQYIYAFSSNLSYNYCISMYFLYAKENSVKLALNTNKSISEKMSYESHHIGFNYFPLNLTMLQFQQANVLSAQC